MGDIDLSGLNAEDKTYAFIKAIQKAQFIDASEKQKIEFLISESEKIAKEQDSPHVPIDSRFVGLKTIEGRIADLKFSDKMRYHITAIVVEIIKGVKNVRL